jgi:hypothetical protein
MTTPPTSPNIVDPALVADPYGGFKRMREETPLVLGQSADGIPAESYPYICVAQPEHPHTGRRIQDQNQASRCPSCLRIPRSQAWSRSAEHRAAQVR